MLKEDLQRAAEELEKLPLTHEIAEIISATRAWIVILDRGRDEEAVRSKIERVLERSKKYIT